MKKEEVKRRIAIKPKSADDYVRRPSNKINLLVAMSVDKNSYGPYLDVFCISRRDCVIKSNQIK